MSNDKAGAPRLAVLHDAPHLTEEEAARVVDAIHRSDVPAIRAELVRAGMRVERGEHLLEQLGWTP